MRSDAPRQSIRLIETSSFTIDVDSMPPDTNNGPATEFVP